MAYYINTTLTSDFNTAITLVTQALQKEGFGVLSDIDIREKLKEKLDVDFRQYRILGACHPPSAYIALQKEDKVGTMLPCNVIVQQLEGGQVEVAAVDPVSSMASIKNPDLENLAMEIRDRLRKVIDSL